MNSQPIEKLRRLNEELLDIHGIFYTIQGEGPHAGRPATFVRLAGCNLQCPMCDTEYTQGRQLMSAQHVARKCFESPTPLVVITGGEPMRQPGQLRELVFELLHRGMDVQIETNGTLPMPVGLTSDDCDIVVSPKTDTVQPRIASQAIAWKYVLDSRSVDPTDGLPVQALGNHVISRVARPSGLPSVRSRRHIYVQPADTQDEAQNALNLQAAMASCMKHGYTLQLQLHKILGVE